MWHVKNEHGHHVCSVRSEELGRSIVLACNSHDRLVKALEASDKFYADLVSDLYSEDHKRGEWISTLKGRVLQERQLSAAALTAAEGKGK